jgi:hypothetical protein
MSRIWRPVQELAGKAAFFLIVGSSLAFERIAHGGHALAMWASESQMDPQETIVHLVSYLLVGSLSMLALGYHGRG